MGSIGVRMQKIWALEHYYRKGLHRRFKNVITDGFVSRLSLWVSDDMRSSQTVINSESSVIVDYHRRFVDETVCDDLMSLLTYKLRRLTKPSVKTFSVVVCRVGDCTILTL